MRTQYLPPEDMKAIVEYFNKRMPELVAAIRPDKFAEAWGSDDYGYGKEAVNWQMARQANEKENPAHANVSPENIEALDKEETLEHMLLGKIVEELREKGVRATPLQVRNALLEDRVANAPKGMPDRVYRGVAPWHIERHGDPEETGFIGQDSFTKGQKVVFVSPEPAVAASYARRGQFDRSQGDLATKPTNYGDYVYEIDTTGLDPKKFRIDTSSTPGELLFGGQYAYDGDIPQGTIDIVDIAGNSRTIPRIRKILLSDALCKDVYLTTKTGTAVVDDTDGRPKKWPLMARRHNALENKPNSEIISSLKRRFG